MAIEAEGWNPKLYLLYFDTENGKTVFTLDGAGLRRGDEVAITNNQLTANADAMSFTFEFEKTSEGAILLKSFSGAVKYAELYKNQPFFQMAGQAFSRPWEQISGTTYHIVFNQTKFIEGLMGSNPEGGHPYYTIAHGRGWKSETADYGKLMGVALPSWKGNGIASMLVEKRAARSPKINIYTRNGSL